MIAVLLWVLTAIAAWRLRRCGDLTLSRPGMVLVGLVGLQILLGVGTWVVNYGWPAFLGRVTVETLGSTGYLIHAKGFVDSIIVTAHVATGSLILAVSTLAVSSDTSRSGSSAASPGYALGRRCIQRRFFRCTRSITYRLMAIDILTVDAGTDRNMRFDPARPRVAI